MQHIVMGKVTAGTTNRCHSRLEHLDGTLVKTSGHICSEENQNRTALIVVRFHSNSSGEGPVGSRTNPSRNKAPDAEAAYRRPAGGTYGARFTRLSGVMSALVTAPMDMYQHSFSGAFGEGR